MFKKIKNSAYREELRILLRERLTIKERAKYHERKSVELFKLLKEIEEKIEHLEKF